MSDGNVVSLAGVRDAGGGALERHTTGVAICVHCRHEWAAVTPVGAGSLECPKCGTHRATWKHPFAAETPIYHCRCGNEYFVLHTDPILCANCGTQHSDVWR